MPLISTIGAASSRGFGEFNQTSVPVYIEDVFGTYVYTGNNSSRSISNGIDLSTKGGLVWIKSRNNSASHDLFDTSRGVGRVLYTDGTAAQGSFNSTTLTSFNTTGFSLGTDNTSQVNQNNWTYASWTFRKQPKFFDVITWTGDGSTSKVVPHNLQSVPYFVIAKRTDTSGDWFVLAKSTGNSLHYGTSGTPFAINLTNPSSGTLSPSGFGITSTSIDVGSLQLASGGAQTNAANISGGTYVAYLFAHNAGGFGLDGTQNVVSCGEFTYSNSTGATVNLGYQPQWIMYKSSTANGGGTNWIMHDMMRGMPVPPSGTATLSANNSGAESSSFPRAYPTSTGFALPSGLGAGDNYVYLAIRRGPMKIPTDGTKVYTPVIRTGTGGSNITVTSNFATDFFIQRNRTSGALSTVADKLRGLRYLETGSTNAQTSDSGGDGYDLDAFLNTGILVGAPSSTQMNSFGWNEVYWHMVRSPSFMDVVWYRGNGATNQTVTHNLGVQPELILYKSTTNSAYWIVHTPSLISQSKFLWFNSTAAADNNSTQGYTNSNTPTATTIGPGNTQLNISGWDYVAYLFATCPGVSKVGTYTGTGSTQTISCGFTGGARFVLIKRVDGTGAWWVWDSARGMVAGTDIRIRLDDTTIPETNADWVYTTTGGFQVVTSDSSVNANGGTYLFLAIA